MLFKKDESAKLRPGEFYNAGLGCRFAIPERVTVRVHQSYVTARKEAEKAGATSMLAQNWVAAVAIIEEWDCKDLPDYKATIDEIADRQLAVINWAGTEVFNYIIELFAIPKN